MVRQPSKQRPPPPFAVLSTALPQRAAHTKGVCNTTIAVPLNRTRCTGPLCPRSVRVWASGSGSRRVAAAAAMFLVYTLRNRSYLHHDTRTGGVEEQQQTYGDSAAVQGMA